MKVSINTAVFLDELQAQVSQLTCLQQLTATAIDAIEVRGEFFQPATKATELQKIDQLCQQQNWQFYYSVPEELFQGSQVNPQLAANLAMAQQNHIKSLKFSLGDCQQISSTVLAKLQHQLAATTVQVTIENQPNEYGRLSNIESQLTLLKTAQSSLGYTFDAGNWCWVDTVPLTAFNKLQSAITVFHLKAIENQETVLLTKPAADWQQMLAQLQPTIPVFLEYAIPTKQLAAQIDLVNQQLQQRQAAL
ncbi:sugar phosphate isomerase/epimerase [Loigolactobacillus zhaoyuanensis]|uniref:Sugar phosphate isomerase/epimerase n=1 Tax=Loigolactobacillus zhaoyuanensis TaxID=2486017 RepID=A0ABW8UFN7_9LACO|nr:sugar phosphate isomerase/epimerase [Loigolactobacillus zhaoyuanensis]